MFKKILFTVFCLLLLVTYHKDEIKVSANEEIEDKIDLGIESQGCILIDVNSGKTIYEKNSDEKLYPASMTKMMGMLLVLDAINNHKLSYDKIVTISLEASKMGGSQVFLEMGEKLTVDELFKCVAIASANDAMYALAEIVSGSEKLFVNEMNKKAKSLGMNNTNFANTTGFDDPNHYSCPKDMSILAKELLQNYEEDVIKYTSLKEGYIRENTNEPFWLVNTNRLLGDYEGIDGLKTGFTQDAGFCLTSTAKRDNLRLVSVVMKANNKEMRTRDTIKLLDYGFANYKAIKLYSKGEIICTCSFNHSANKDTPVFIGEDVFVTLKSNENIDNIKKEIIITKNSAPIKKNDKIGVIKIIISENECKEFNLYSQENVSFLHWYDYFISLLLDMLF